MRRILLDHAKADQAAKRGGDARAVSIDDVTGLFKKKDLDLIALDEALKTLAEMDPQQSRIVEIRYFGGLSIEETALALGISPATVKREWSAAKAWLHREIKKQ
jgi:RNA polymerase sigma factor (TIGR02999 family)